MIIEIDGSYGEGGGQIVRTALFFSLLSGKGVRIYNIRKGRPKPGLKPQHLNVIKALELFTDSEVRNAREGSLEITFLPGRIKGGNVTIDIKTAGSITLLLQTLLPVLSFAEKPSTITVKGGTDVPMSMSSEYMREVIIPLLKPYVNEIEFKIQRRGFYPAGGGIITLEVKPLFNRSKFKTLDEFIGTLRRNCPQLNLQNRGKLKKVKIFSFASDQLRGRKVAERLVDGALSLLSELKLPIENNIKYGPSRSPGCVITIVATFDNGIRIGSDGLGKPGKPAEKVGAETANYFLNIFNSEATVDPHLQDNLIPWMVLFGGIFKINGGLTRHTETNIWVSSKFVKTHFIIKNKEIKTEI